MHRDVWSCCSKRRNWVTSVLVMRSCYASNWWKPPTVVYGRNYRLRATTLKLHPTRNTIAWQALRSANGALNNENERCIERGGVKSLQKVRVSQNFRQISQVSQYRSLTISFRLGASNFFGKLSRSLTFSYFFCFLSNRSGRHIGFQRPERPWVPPW